MYDELAKTIASEISPAYAFDELQKVYAIDRWFTFPAFARSAAHAVSRWKDFGLADAKVDRFRADGRATAGAWVMPYAWDVDDAALTIVEPAEFAGTVVAHYRETPCSLAMWSGPTPAKGVTADLVWIEDAAESAAYKDIDVKGKIVFTSTRGVYAKGQAAQRGAIGILSDFVTGRLEKPDETFWTNAWSDDPSGWALIERDSRIFGFNIPPRKGDWLRSVIKRCGRVRVKAVVKTKLYNGFLPSATAVIPGQSRRSEVLVLGHAFEQGSNDNASGVAVMLESARALAKLVREGRIPRPKRTIRFLVVSECYSTFAYSERYARRMRNTVAGVCFDQVAGKQALCKGILGLSRPPESNASFVTAFAERLAEKTFSWRAEFKWQSTPFATTDNIVADPLIGPPTVLFSTYPSDLFWHSTGDTLDKIDVEALGKVCQFAAVYLYAIASAGAVDALYFAALATARAKGELSRAMTETIGACRDHGTDFETASKRILYLAKRGAREVESVKSLLTPKELKSIQMELATMAGEVITAGRVDVQQLERLLAQCGQPKAAAAIDADEKAYRSKAESIIPTRKYIGMMSLDLIAPKDREGFEETRWNDGVTATLFWCDGKRTLAEALDLAGSELGRNLFALVPVFEFIGKKGLIELKKA